MNEFGYQEEVEKIEEEPKLKVEKKKGTGWLKFILFILICVLGVVIGLALGFYLGMLALINVMEDLTENVTVNIEFDEDAAMDYATTFFKEEYGDLFKAAILDQNLKLNMTNNEKIKTIMEGLDLEGLELEDYAGINNSQLAIAQTRQNFVPEGLITEIESLKSIPMLN